MKNLAIPANGSGGVTPIEQRDAALVALARGCGLCAEEIARLDVAAVDPLCGTLRVPRRDGTARDVPAGLAPMRALLDYLARARGVLAAGAAEPALFLSKSGRRMCGSDVRRRLAAADHPGSDDFGAGTRIESASLRAAYVRSHPRA